jgi:uncharacterized protein (DUF1015 family)
MQIKAFRTLRPPEPLASRVSAPPYDVVDEEEAREIVAANPDSFMRVIRPETCLPAGADPHSDVAYECAAGVFAEFQRRELLQQDTTPRLFVYEQRSGSHRQRAVVGCCHADDYRDGVIKVHERTRHDKEADRERHIQRLRAHTGLVFVTYHDDAAIDVLVNRVCEDTALYRFAAEDGVQHTVWIVPDAPAMTSAFADVRRAYIADGHHRAAASVDVAGRLSAEAEAQWFPAALFPSSQLRILPVHRLVSGLPPPDVAALEGKAAAAFRVKPLTPGDAGARPSPRAIRMVHRGRWHALDPVDRPGDPVAGLDVSILQDRLLSPALGIRDVRRDQRISFFGGPGGLDAMLSKMAGQGGCVGFVMHPVTVEDMIRVADSGGIMPPKSTWFDPKVRSGLFVHPF